MSNKSATTAATADSTVNELKALLAEAEKALTSSAEQPSEQIEALKLRLRDALDKGRTMIRRSADYAREKAAIADEKIHERPYVAIGVAAGIGAIAGALISRSLSRSA